jgi:hypothetical protein
VLFHFGGIITASLAAPPAPWLVSQVWMRIYRPYLEFMYLNNAYHFYAPEPGPSRFLWFRLIYADRDDKTGALHGVWYKVPTMDERNQPLHSTALEYQRYLAMTEGTALAETAPPTITIDKDGMPTPEPFYKRRMDAVPKDNVIIGLPSPALAIPFHPLVPETQQFSIPNQPARLLLASLARSVCQRPHPDEPKDSDPEHRRYEIRGVKIYQVVHAIPSAEAFALGQDPCDPTNYRPFFMGQYDMDGNLTNREDPFLYWLLPILRYSVGDGSNYVVRNYAVRHAGDPNYELDSTTNKWGPPANAAGAGHE